MMIYLVVLVYHTQGKHMRSRLGSQISCSKYWPSSRQCMCELWHCCRVKSCLLSFIITRISQEWKA